MNIDLVHRQADRFDLFELKVASNTPYDAAIQILQYGAIYLLYRSHRELAELFTDKPIMRASQIGLKVLAPHRYYSLSDVDLRTFEIEIGYQLQSFAVRYELRTKLLFQFMAFPQAFDYSPAMDCAQIQGAIEGIAGLLPASDNA